MGRKVLKIVKWLLFGILMLLIVGSVWNAICRNLEKGDVKGAYGKEVTVSGKQMIVDIAGENGAPVIVLLPGYGSPSPVLEFQPLSDRLSKNFQVITIEPFGYGLSDGTKEERTVEAVSEELHECVQKLGVKEYYLMGHSLSGVYALYWANQYPEEVEGYIGLDPSVPKMTDESPYPISMMTLNKLSTYLGKAMNFVGLTRLLAAGDAKKAIYADLTYPYTKEELEAFRILTLDYAQNGTVLQELNQMGRNLETIRDMKFPAQIPVLEFLSGDNCVTMPNWEQLHKDTIVEEENEEIRILDGGHYVHLEHPKEIAERVEEWISQNR